MDRAHAMARLAEIMAGDDRFGYSNKPPNGRWGPDFDCSSFLYFVAWLAGYPVGIGAGKVRFTGQMTKDFKDAGFELLPYANVGIGDLQIGDILLNLALHAEIYVGEGQLVGAQSAENGGYSGEPGDQTGTEIMKHPAFVKSIVELGNHASNAMDKILDVLVNQMNFDVSPSDVDLNEENGDIVIVQREEDPSWSNAALYMPVDVYVQSISDETDSGYDCIYTTSLKVMDVRRDMERFVKIYADEFGDLPANSVIMEKYVPDRPLGSFQQLVDNLPDIMTFDSLVENAPSEWDVEYNGVDSSTHMSLNAYVAESACFLTNATYEELQPWGYALDMGVIDEGAPRPDFPVLERASTTATVTAVEPVEGFDYNSMDNATVYVLNVPGVGFRILVIGAEAGLAQ